MRDDILKQAEQAALDAEETAREKDVYLYVTALDRGDFEATEPIMERAQRDPKLEEMLWQADVEMAKDEYVPPAQIERAHKMVKHILRQYYEERE